MTDTLEAPLVRSPARFFFETGYFAAYAEAAIHGGHRPPFGLSDAIIDRAWEIAPEAHPDRAEFDQQLCRADSATDRLAAAEAVYRAYVASDLDTDATAEELAACANSLTTFAADLYPANAHGQVHFARVLMDTAATSIRAYLAKAGDQ